MTDTRGSPHRRPDNSGRDAADRRRLWRTYLGITGLLLVILVALAGGIIWYNSKKSSELAFAAAARLMQEADDKITGRIQLLYDPMYAIVGIASLVPELTTPAISDNPRAIALLLRALHIYPQIQSLYVGFDSGDFFMVTHIIGEKSEVLHRALKAPPDAAYANEVITPGNGDKLSASWSFLAEDGSVVGRRDPAPTNFDARQRPWYGAAKHSDTVEESDLYVFASSDEPGFTLSRSFQGPAPGVMGADLAAADLSYFLRSQRITATSTAFIFTTTGEVVALPDPARIGKAEAHTRVPVAATPAIPATAPKISDLDDPVIAGLVAAHRNGQMAGTRIYDVADRTYIARVVEIPPRYGRNQLLAIMVPVDEIERPIIDIRNDTLLYSIAFLVFALPLYVTLVIAWIDRRLQRRVPWPQFRDDE